MLSCKDRIIRPKPTRLLYHKTYIISLKNVSLKVLDDAKEIYSDFGEMLFTHFGVSGPIILS
ncbi:MAG: NAD(P)/FAD-dependent oxidoreductase, partial [Eubacterium sp.]|nr:NAD(P)/FAD-dependent oxidoreductase [Eubacterium sp.]